MFAIDLVRAYEMASRPATSNRPLVLRTMYLSILEIELIKKMSLKCAKDGQRPGTVDLFDLAESEEAMMSSKVFHARFFDLGSCR
jgi:hypothetical protein